MLPPHLLELEALVHVVEIDVGPYCVAHRRPDVIEHAGATLERDVGLKLDRRAVPGFRIEPCFGRHARFIEPVGDLAGDEDEVSADDPMRCRLERRAWRGGHAGNDDDILPAARLLGKGNQLKTAERSRRQQVVDLDMGAGRATGGFDPARARFQIRGCRSRMCAELIDANTAGERRAGRLEDPAAAIEYVVGLKLGPDRRGACVRLASDLGHQSAFRDRPPPGRRGRHSRRP